MAANTLRGLVLLGIPTHIALYRPNRIQKLLLNSLRSILTYVLYLAFSMVLLGMFMSVGWRE